MDNIPAQTLRYPLFDIYWDYLKTLFGLSIGVGGLLYGSDHLVSLIFFSAITVLFCFFGLQSYQRHKSKVTIDQEGLTFSTWKQKSISWKTVKNIELRYFGRPVKDPLKNPDKHPVNHREVDQKPKGVLHLTLKGDDEKITIESSLYGFRYLVWCATQVAKEYNAPLDQNTIGNMLDIGLDPEGDSEMPDPHTSGI